MRKRRKGKKRRNARSANRTQERAIEVYRGTKNSEESWLFFETDGYILSDAARDGYYQYVFDGYDFPTSWSMGLRHSNEVLQAELDAKGGPANYSFAHSTLGTERSNWPRKRPSVSWTTKLWLAEYFATPDGYVFTATIPVENILNPDWEQNEEAEILIPNGTWATVHRWPTSR